MYDIWKGSTRKEHIIESIQVYSNIKFVNHTYKKTSRATVINKKKEWSKSISSDAIIIPSRLNLAELHC